MSPSRVSHIFLFLLLTAQYGFMNDICRNKRFTHLIPGFALSNHVIGHFNVVDKEHCQLKCYLEKSCFSYNFGSVEWNAYNCELNSADSSSHPADLRVRDGWVHQTAEELCGDTVCPSYAVCRYDSHGNRDRCICKPGVTRDDCEVQRWPPWLHYDGYIHEALGMKKRAAAKSCKQLKMLMPSLPTGIYWIDPDDGSSNNAFQAFCDMETDSGGWTLVYSYTFTDYEHFMENTNAVTPTPDWPNRGAVPLSTTTPLNETHFAAMRFELWRLIGSEVLIKSNINNWIACLPHEGSLVDWQPGSIICRMIKHVATQCTDIVPEIIQPGPTCGVRFRAGNNWKSNYYSLNVCFKGSRPHHDPCATASDNHVKGVQNPHGNVFVR